LPEPIHTRNGRRKHLSSPPSVLDRHSQNAARSSYRRALIAVILQATGKPLQTPAFVEGRSHERSHQVCDDHRRGALGHAHERLIYGLGSYERAKRRASVGETDQQRASVCEGCRSMQPLTYIMCHLAFGGLPLDAVSAIQSELMPAFSEI
jgi:hypothetical protein